MNEETLKKLIEVRTICQLCPDRPCFKLLGSHLWGKHEMRAKEYKRQMGIDYQIPLTDDSVREKHRQDARERIGEITEKLAKSGAKFRIKKGQKITGRYKSEQRLEQLAHLNEARQKIDKECGRCHRIKKMVAWRKWCEDCLPAIKSSRNHNEYHEEWYRRRAQDPAWRAERTRKHAEWVKKNAAHLVEYRRQRKEAAATST